jgi:hypothetical protein
MGLHQTKKCLHRTGNNQQSEETKISLCLIQLKHKESSKWTFHLGNTNGQQINKIMFNIFNYQGNAIQNNHKIISSSLYWVLSKSQKITNTGKMKRNRSFGNIN